MDAAELIERYPNAPLVAGDRLGRYLLLCPIAQGGMGQVWAARQTGPLGLPKLVAIKIAIPLETTSPELIQQYLFDEAQVASSIDHPNVCKILELGQESQTLFIAMEWLYGASLSALLGAVPERRLDFRMSAHLVAQACSGLHAAHELTDDEGVNLEVVHRDATPHNFFITTAGELKVMDFGIVKSKNQQHQTTQTGELKGKLSYLAPEQIRGKNVDRRADVFALGGVLYLTTLGHTAFSSRGEDAGSTILRITQGDYPAPSTIDPAYPPELEAIVKRALAVDVSDRFQTAEEMRLALQNYLDESSRPVAREQVAQLLKRHCGASIEQRRADIRRAQKQFDVKYNNYPASGTYPAGDTDWNTPTPVVPGESTGTPEPVVDPSSSGSSRSASTLLRSADAQHNRWLWLLTGVASALVLGLVLWRSAGSPSAPAAQASAAVSTAQVEPTKVAEQIRLEVTSDPADADLQLDNGEPVTSPHTFSVPRDQREHLLQLSAKGRLPVSKPVTFDRDQVVFVRLLENGERQRTTSNTRKSGLARAGKWAAPKDALTASEATGPAPGNKASPAEGTPFSETVIRRTPRHAIDESDPFAK